jgi:hypothetical protein
MNRLPEFNAVLTLGRAKRRYRTGVAGLTGSAGTILPQAGFRSFARTGGFGGFGGFGGLGLDPLPDECSECEQQCTPVPCDPPRPRCRGERCTDVCRSVPCSSFSAV